MLGNSLNRLFERIVGWSEQIQGLRTLDHDQNVWIVCNVMLSHAESPSTGSGASVDFRMTEHMFSSMMIRATSVLGRRSTCRSMGARNSWEVLRHMLRPTRTQASQVGNVLLELLPYPFFLKDSASSPCCLSMAQHDICLTNLIRLCDKNTINVNGINLL